MSPRVSTRWTPDAVRKHCARNVTTSVEVAGEILGMCRSSAYNAIKRGTFPVPVIKPSGRNWVVPTAALLRLLELADASTP